MLKRCLRIGYTCAARLIESMEAESIIGPPEPGSRTRQILDYGRGTLVHCSPRNDRLPEEE